MDNLSDELINTILDRTHIENQIMDYLTNFYKYYSETSVPAELLPPSKAKQMMQFKKGIYLYGSSGCGKSKFITRLLTRLNYKIIQYNACDTRNKALIESITCNNISNRSILSTLQNKKQRLAIIMNNTEGLNMGDRGSITALIKLIRQKKTKKQKQESRTMNPIICIGTYYVDKKIKELMKVCNVFEIPKPTDLQIHKLYKAMYPLSTYQLTPTIDAYIQGDIRKFNFVCMVLLKNGDTISPNNLMIQYFLNKSYNDNSQKPTQQLFNKSFGFNEHNTFMNDTDRTIVSLLWHENVIDILETYPVDKAIDIYRRILDNLCFADYIDRITFQNQIWQFNEMSSLIKTFYNNYLLHKFMNNEKPIIANKKKETTIPIRFTKVLTKYSTEYNNILFIQRLCNELVMDKKDMIAMFRELRNKHKDSIDMISEIEDELKKTSPLIDINKLSIRRIYRYLDKNINDMESESELDDDDLDDLDDNDNDVDE